MRAMPITLFVIAGAQHAAWAEPRAPRAPTPRWVEPVEARPADSVPVVDGIAWLLVDQQRWFDAKRGAVSYHRWVARVAGEAGLEQATWLELELRPGERVELHQARLLRNGKEAEPTLAIDDEPGDSFTLELEDVAVGDIVDVAYSVTSAAVPGEPVFADDVLAYAAPVGRLHWRLSAPRELGLVVTPLAGAAAPERSERDGRVELALRWDDVAGAPDVAMAPDWFRARAALAVTEPQTWPDVAEVAAASWQRSPRSPAVEAAVAAAARELVADASAAEGQLRAVAGFVASEIDEVEGDGGGDLGTVLARRAGSEHQRVELLVALFEALGFEVGIALASVGHDGELDALPPSPGWFDAVLVVATRDGTSWWLDPNDPATAEASWTLPRRALPLYGEIAQLVAVPRAAPPRIASYWVKEQLRAGAGATVPGEVEVESRWRGADADEMEGRAADSEASLTEEWRSYQEERWGEVRDYAEVTLARESDGELVAHERFVLPSFWVDGRRDINFAELASELPRPDEQRPAAPLALPYPHDREYQATITVAGTGRLDAEDARSVVDNDWFEYRFEAVNDGDTTRIGIWLRTKTDVVAAADVPAYRREVERAFDAAGYWFESGWPAGDGEGKPWWAKVIAAVFAGGFGLALLYSLREQLRMRSARGG